MKKTNTKTLWFTELLDEVQRALQKSTSDHARSRPNLEEEVRQIDTQIHGWSISLAKPSLPAAVRTNLESQWQVAEERKGQINAILAEEDRRACQRDHLFDKDDVLKRLDRLADILAEHNPTRGNLELSLHIDRITCHPDGRVMMRMCKLGLLPSAAQLLVGDNRLENQRPSSVPKRGGPRRRTRLRIPASSQSNERSLTDFAADMNRFAGLGDEWFWHDEFHIPPRDPSWVARNSEAVFQRRQQKQLSYAALAKEFGVSSKTIGDAIRLYLSQRPDAKDTVKIGRGGRRRPKFDLAQICGEARRLWESGCSQEDIATILGCSPPTAVKALSYSSKQLGLPVPTRREVRARLVARAKDLLTSHSIEDVCDLLGVTNITTRKYLHRTLSKFNPSGDSCSEDAATHRAAAQTRSK